MDKQIKKVVVVDVAVPSNSNIKKKKHEKVKARSVPVVIGRLRAVTPKLGEWLPQITGMTSDCSVQKRAASGRV